MNNPLRSPNSDQPTPPTNPGPTFNSAPTQLTPGQAPPARFPAGDANRGSAPSPSFAPHPQAALAPTASFTPPPNQGKQPFKALSHKPILASTAAVLLILTGMWAGWSGQGPKVEELSQQDLALASEIGQLEADLSDLETALPVAQRTASGHKAMEAALDQRDEELDQAQSAESARTAALTVRAASLTDRETDIAAREKAKQEEEARLAAEAAAAAAAAASSATSPGSSGGNVYFKNCTEAKAAGAAPLYRGEPGYRPALDRDNDGIACER